MPIASGITLAPRRPNAKIIAKALPRSAMSVLDRATPIMVGKIGPNMRPVKIIIPAAVVLDFVMLIKTIIIKDKIARIAIVLIPISGVIKAEAMSLEIIRLSQNEQRSMLDPLSEKPKLLP